MSCKELPTNQGAIVRWTDYYDGMNYHCATLTNDRIYDLDEFGNFQYVQDPDYPEDYGPDEEPEMVAKMLHEGLCWHISGESKALSPEQFAKRFAVDHAWWAKYQPERAPGPDENFRVTVVDPGWARWNREEGHVR